MSNIDVAAGETVTCTFTNHKRGQIVVVKDADPDDPQDFAFTAGGGLSPTSFSLDDDADGTLSNTRTFANVAGGLGYSLVRDGAQRLGPDVRHLQRRQPGVEHRRRAGETVTCTFVNNRKRGQIVVVKDAQPNDPQDFSFTAGGGLSPGSFQLDDDADRDAVEHAHVRRRRARVRLLGLGDRRRAAGTSRAPPVTTAARCRTSACPPARRSPARS